MAGEILGQQRSHLDEVELRLSAQMELITTQLASEDDSGPSETLPNLSGWRRRA